MVKQINFEPNYPSTAQSNAVSQPIQKKLSMEEAQESIYRTLLNIVKQSSPEIALQEFKHLFIQHTDSGSSDLLEAMYEIVFANNEEEFHYTIKRSCYILVNNWTAKPNHKYTQKLIELFEDSILSRKSFSPTINRLRTWTRNFTNSKDYQELKLFVSSKYRKEQSRLSDRYKSHLLVAQSADTKNPLEQREAALNRATQLKYRFKFDLAMYMAHLESTSINKQSKNPTELGDEALRVIKIIVAKQDPARYENMAKNFLTITEKQTYKEFKQTLQKYLACSGENRQLTDALNLSLSNKLIPLYETSHEQITNERLLLRTCNQLINCLTTENHRQPSSILRLLMSQGHPLTVVIILLKIVLICRPARPHLESCIADLIRHYEDSAEESKWMIHFLEIFNIIFAIYADNISIHLEKVLAD